MKVKKNKKNEFYVDNLDVVVTVERVEDGMCFLTTTLKSKDGFVFDFGARNLALRSGDTLNISGLEFRMKLDGAKRK